MEITLLDRKILFPLAIKALKKVRIVLDIGCGIQPQRYLTPKVHICCEPFQQYIDHLQKKLPTEGSTSFVVIKSTWEQIINLLPPKSIDTIFLNDVIEHLEKDKALELLKATESIARVQIAIFTPLGFMPQYHQNGKDAWGLDGGSWQEHKSGWLPSDFDNTWEIYVSKEYHYADSSGNVLEKPYGALWAIKNFKQRSLFEKFKLHAYKEFLIFKLKIINLIKKVIK